MSSFTRFIQPLPAARRGYSSFFSSKPGNGRYFNSARPTKTVVTNSEAKKSSSRDPAATSGERSPDGLQNVDSGLSGSSLSISVALGTEDPSSPGPASSSTPSGNQSSSPPSAGPVDHFSFLQQSAPSHPMIDAKNFKLHQFFSVHRPLLLLSDPTAILQSAPPDAPLVPAPHGEKNSQPQWPRTVASDSMEAFDADIDTARQLNRALTMTHAGNVAAWEDTLRRLGLDIDQQPDRVGLQEQMDKEWQDVMMDSVKRKRRKKMKKHKRKKRRRLSRAERQRERSSS